MVDPLSQVKTNAEEIELPAQLVEQMRQHVIDCMPYEACGLIAGKPGYAQAVYPIKNELNSPARFRMDPHQQLAAFEQIDELGLELLAIYHSHPNGPHIPSPTDIAEAYYPQVLHLIWCCQAGGWSMRAFSIHQKQVREISLIVKGIE